MVFFFSYIYSHQKHFDYPTPVSRLNLLHALFTERTFQIDAYHKNTPDKAVFKGHYYSDKAPGTVVLAAPHLQLQSAFCISLAPHWIRRKAGSSRVGLRARDPLRLSLLWEAWRYLLG